MILNYLRSDFYTYNIEVWLKRTDLGNICSPSTTQNFLRIAEGPPMQKKRRVFYNSRTCYQDCWHTGLMGSRTCWLLTQSAIWWLTWVIC